MKYFANDSNLHSYVDLPGFTHMGPNESNLNQSEPKIANWNGKFEIEFFVVVGCISAVFSFY